MSENEFAKQLDDINKDYKERAPQHTSSEKENGDPNIFEILGIENKEVLICRILGDLLNPNGKINSGNSDPLKLFLSQVLNINHVCAEKDFEHAEIVLEEVIDENRRVDIVIKIGGEIYPIEVKIWAEDQPSQLFDYYHYYFGEYHVGKTYDKTIYYLTPTGKKPSSNSLEKEIEKGSGKVSLPNSSYLPISFDKHILSWLDKLKLDNFDKTAQFIITQFKEVIRKMTIEQQKRKALYEALGYTAKEGFKHEYNELLLTILDNHDHIKKSIQQAYLRSHCPLDENVYTLSDVDKEDEKTDSHCVLKIIKNGETVARLCIATNLYIATEERRVKEEARNRWKTESSKKGTYCWQYLHYKDKQDLLDLNDIKKCLGDGPKIDIEKALEDCE